MHLKKLIGILEQKFDVSTPSDKLQGLELENKELREQISILKMTLKVYNLLKNFKHDYKDSKSELTQEWARIQGKKGNP